MTSSTVHTVTHVTGNPADRNGLIRRRLYDVVINEQRHGMQRTGRQMEAV